MSKTDFAQLSDQVDLDHPILAGDITRTALLGHWINSNPDTNSIARLDVTESDNALRVQVSAVGPNGLIDWGTTTADVFAAGPASDAGAGFTCTYDFGFAEARFQGMIMKGLLVLAQFHIFKDDSRRANYFLREYFAMTHDHF
jgi:hypothetical protein